MVKRVRRNKVNEMAADVAHTHGGLAAVLAGCAVNVASPQSHAAQRCLELLADDRADGDIHAAGAEAQAQRPLERGQQQRVLLRQLQAEARGGEYSLSSPGRTRTLCPP